MDANFMIERLRTVPFGTLSDHEWYQVAEILRLSFQEHLHLPLEFVIDRRPAGDRKPDGDNFAPLIQCSENLNAALNLQMAGMIAAGTTSRTSGLKIQAHLFFFISEKRVVAPNGLFLTFLCSISDDGLYWGNAGWETSDFEEQWDQYTYDKFFLQS
jgi:hypothetical protein